MGEAGGSLQVGGPGCKREVEGKRGGRGGDIGAVGERLEDFLVLERDREARVIGGVQVPGGSADGRGSVAARRLGADRGEGVAPRGTANQRQVDEPSEEHGVTVPRSLDYS
jgi:hypothetical protein